MTSPSANMVLENPSIDIPKVFGPSSPEANQLAADPDPYKDPETADYLGLAIHCANGDQLCASAEAVKYGTTTPSHTAVADLLPDEPGGYSGYQVLFGSKYIAPVLGAGTPNLVHNGYAVTNAAGNLVDENGNEIDGAYLNNYPGFPGFGSINASQTLGYMADMQESGVPVTYGYISDIHGNAYIDGLTGQANRAITPRRHSAAAAPAMWPRRSTTTRPSRPSSSAWPRTASRLRTACSSSVRTRVTTRRGRTSAGPSAHAG